MNLNKMYMLSETMMGKDMASEKFGQNRTQNKVWYTVTWQTLIKLFARP